MKYLLFFTALITTAAAADLNCICTAPTIGPVCKDNTCTIPKGQCYSSQWELAAGKDKPVTAGTKGCQEDKGPNVCNEGVVFISADDAFYLLSNVTCCNDKNECNKGVVVALPAFSDLNKTVSSKKLVCPACFSLDKKPCDAVQMNCREGQDKCFSIKGTITRGTTPAQDFAAKGCAAPSTILRNGATLTFGSDSYKLDNVEVVEAKSGVSQISSCLSFAILLPSVLWFLLDSSLY